MPTPDIVIDRMREIVKGAGAMTNDPGGDDEPPELIDLADLPVRDEPPMVDAEPRREVAPILVLENELQQHEEQPVDNVVDHTEPRIPNKS